MALDDLTVNGDDEAGIGGCAKRDDTIKSTDAYYRMLYLSACLHGAII